MEVGLVFFSLFVELDKPPSECELAAVARVGKTFACKVMNEMKDSSRIFPVEILK